MNINPRDRQDDLKQNPRPNQQPGKQQPEKKQPFKQQPGTPQKDHQADETQKSNTPQYNAPGCGDRGDRSEQTPDHAHDVEGGNKKNVNDRTDTERSCEK